MLFSGWLTLIVLIAMFVALVREWGATEVIVSAALLVLWLAGVVDSDEALAGFSSQQVLTVAFLFVVSQALQETGALGRISALMLGSDGTKKRGMVRFLVPVAALSGVMNNTPLVAILTPAVRDWAIRIGKSPSKFLIPLSYAAILGGTCTLIGTSTNLVVSGLLEQAGYETLAMFELSPVGVPATILGIIFLLLFAPVLLPARRAVGETAADRSREYEVQLRVRGEYPFLGRTVQQAGLRNLGGLFLAEILRGDTRIVPVTPTHKIREGDILLFVGAVETVAELRKTPGLETVREEEDDERGTGPERERHLYEVVLSESSPLLGTTLREYGFRRRYGAAVIAIHRRGESLRQKLGEVELRAGDTLMVEGAPGFRKAWAYDRDFYMVTQVERSELPRFAYANGALSILIAMILVIAMGWLPPVQAAALAAMGMIVTRCIRSTEARKAIPLNVITVIAASFGLSAAVINSGLADMVSSGLLEVFADARPWTVLASVYILTQVLTEALSNNAAAALVFPIALRIAEQRALLEGIEADPRPYAIAVAIAASMSFVTPMGYQTNLMVYGPGGYRFGDFARVGIPLSLICFVTTMVVIPLVWGL